MPTQNGDASLAACAEAAGLQPDAMRGLQDPPRRRLRPARQAGLRDQGGAARQADCRASRSSCSGRARRTCARAGSARCRSAKMQAGLDDKGNLVGFTMRIAGQSILNTVAPGAHGERRRLHHLPGPEAVNGPRAAEGGFGYSIPNLTIDYAMRNLHLRPGFWRGVNNNQNAFYIECFLDEVAKAAGKDPLAFRRDLMKESSEASRRAQCGRRQRSAGKRRSRRPAASAASPSRWATAATSRRAAEVSVSDRGKVKVHRLVDGHRQRPCGQSRSGRRAGRRLGRLRPLGDVLRGNHHQGRRGCRGESRHLRDPAHGRLPEASRR